MLINISSLSQTGMTSGITELVDDLARMQDNAEVKSNYSTNSVALAMADDLSMLLSTMLQNRRADKAQSNSTDAEKNIYEYWKKKNQNILQKL